MELVIGDKAWSSWSMRPWLVLRRAALPFEERLVRLRREDTREALRAAGSPSGLIPVLRTDDGAVIWDSLAICEWAAEHAPEAHLWPASLTARALAPLPLLLSYTHRLLEPGGTALLMKGERADTEIAAAQRIWRFDVETIGPDANGARILKISRLEPAHDCPQ